MHKLIMLLSILLIFSTMEAQVTEETKSNLEAIRSGRIYFGHQSVGNNILQGVRELAAQAGTEPPNIVRTENYNAISGSYLAETAIGANGDPASKCSDFLRTAMSFPGDGLDLAIMKFCYVDFTPHTDVNEVFQLYRRTVDSLRTASPRVTIVHSTVPLLVRAPLWKRFARWVLGREDLQDKGNIVRMKYNTLIMQAYANEPVFDIASCESTLPGGARSSFTDEGKTIYALADQYTDDGGHLNQLGRKVVAEEFVKVLREALELRRQSATANP